ncbi:MAG: TVP38/TMEM64 family protein [Pseudomonadales bacterium]
MIITTWVDSIGGYDTLRQRYGLLAPTLSVLTLAVFAVTPFPSDFISIASGAMYGFWPGVLVSWIGWYLAAVVEFTIGRRSRADFPVDDWLTKLPAWLQSVPVHHPVFLICSRFIPYAGGHIATLIPGALGVHPVRFAWCAAISIVPLALLMAGIGAGLLSLL